MELVALEELPIITTHIEMPVADEAGWRVGLEEGEDFLRVAVYDGNGDLKKASFFSFSRMDADAVQSWITAGQEFKNLIEKGWDHKDEAGPTIG